MLNQHFEFFREHGYDDLNFGALYKWAVIIIHFHNCFPEPKDLRILDIFSKSDFKRESWRNKLTKIFGFLRVGFRRYFSSAHD
jgi:hypothetical protein